MEWNNEPNNPNHADILVLRESQNTKRLTPYALLHHVHAVNYEAMY